MAKQQMGGLVVDRRDLVKAGLGVAGVLAGLGLMTGFGGVIPAMAAGAPYRFVEVDSLDDVEHSGIHLNRCDVMLQTADYTMATGDFRLEETDQWQRGSMAVTVPYDPGADRSWSGTFEARWDGIALDVDGAPLDLYVTLTGARTLGYIGSGMSDTRTIVMFSYPGEWNQGLWCKSNVTNGTDDTWSLPVAVTVDVRFTRAGTDEPALGRYRFDLRDVDTLSNASDDFDESVRLIDGFDSEIWVYPGTTIELDAGNGWCRATAPTPTDQSPTEEMSVMTGASFSIEWRGQACETALFDSLDDWGAAAAASYGARVDKAAANGSWL